MSRGYFQLISYNATCVCLATKNGPRDKISMYKMQSFMPNEKVIQFKNRMRFNLIPLEHTMVYYKQHTSDGQIATNETL